MSGQSLLRAAQHYGLQSPPWRHWRSAWEALPPSSPSSTASCFGRCHCQIPISLSSLAPSSVTRPGARQACRSKSFAIGNARATRWHRPRAGAIGESRIRATRARDGQCFTASGKVRDPRARSPHSTLGSSRKPLPCRVEGATAVSATSLSGEGAESVAPPRADGELGAAKDSPSVESGSA